MRKHTFDDDGCCFHCGFDGAEWQHWKTQTHEGRALAGAAAGDDRMPMPECIERQPNSIPEGSKLSVWRGGEWHRIDKEADDGR